MEEKRKILLGYGLLAQAVIKNYVYMIGTPEYGLYVFNIHDKRRWLREQLRWIVLNNFWFDAYEEFFGYNAGQVKSRIIDKINSELGKKYEGD